MVLAAALVCCNQEREVRKYSESKTAEPAPIENVRQIPATIPGAAPGEVHFSWKTPAGWQPLEDTTGLRLAAFSIAAGERKALCTIISLQGTAGGLEANVLRWAGQLDLAMEPGSKELEEFLAKKETFRTRDDLPAVSIDFTGLTPAPGCKSILATVISLETATIFIKLTGSKSLLLENKEKFAALSRSFSLDRKITNKR